MIIKICTYVMLLIHIGLMLSPWSWLKFGKLLMWIASLTSSMPDAIVYGRMDLSLRDVSHVGEYVREGRGDVAEDDCQLDKTSCSRIQEGVKKHGRPFVSKLILCN